MLTCLCTSLSVELSCSLSFLQALLAPIPRLPVLAVWSISRSLSLSLKLVCSRSASLHLTTALFACWRSGVNHIRDLAVSHRLHHLYLYWHLWSRDRFLRNLDHLLGLFDMTSTRSFQGVRIPPGTFLLQNSRCKFGFFSH